MKSGAVTSLYANGFGYINTQFVKSINIRRIEDTDDSFIIHPFFDVGEPPTPANRVPSQTNLDLCLLICSLLTAQLN